MRVTLTCVGIADLGCGSCQVVVTYKLYEYFNHKISHHPVAVTRCFVVHPITSVVVLQHAAGYVANAVVRCPR